MRKKNAETQATTLTRRSVRDRGFRPAFGRVVFSITRVEILLFLSLWFVYGAAINSDNLLQFNLQQIGVEAIVERGHFYLEGSTSAHLQPLGDVFLHDGHKYAAKQPGQFMAGAVIYGVLRAVGLSYTNNYLLVSALVTFFTTSLALAASNIAVFRISRGLVKDGRALFWPLAATLAYALATTAFAYSGIAHHDALADAFLVLAFYLIFRLSRRRSAGGRGEPFSSACAGLLLGLTLTTSMLPFFMVLVCGLYFLSLRRWNLIPLFLCGAFAGLLPLFIYDAMSFGNPLLLANVAGAGMFADTFFYLDPKNFGDKIAFYAGSLVVYAPVFVLGLFGLTYYPRALKREPVFLATVALPIVLAAYVFNIATTGDCQFGPRYLLPAMPFACLGLAGYSHLSKLSERRFAGIVVIAVGLVSFVVNLVGAVRGAMCCPDGRGALRDQLAALTRGEPHSYPLARLLLIPLVISLLILVLTFAARRVADDSALKSEGA
ncbi:MAG: hypothetical protein WCD76_08685 [Pyrinomonadaceae bacterium]